jgi:hypothetical protein
VYERDPRTGKWRRTARLRPKGANIGISVLFQSNYAFGSAVAVKGDHLLVSAHNIGQYNKSKESAVYYYQRQPRTRRWTQKAKILVDPNRKPSTSKGVAVTRDYIVIGDGSLPTRKNHPLSGGFYSFDLDVLNSK